MRRTYVTHNDEDERGQREMDTNRDKNRKERVLGDWQEQIDVQTHTHTCAHTDTQIHTRAHSHKRLRAHTHTRTQTHARTHKHKHWEKDWTQKRVAEKIPTWPEEPRHRCRQPAEHSLMYQCGTPYIPSAGPLSPETKSNKQFPFDSSQVLINANINRTILEPPPDLHSVDWRHHNSDHIKR